MSEFDNVNTVKARYEQLTVDRQNALDKARRASKVTMYGLIPETDEPTSTNTFKNSYSSFGNKAVGTLASSLTFSVLPASQSFYRKEIEESDFSQQELAVLAQEIQGGGTLSEKIKRVLINNSSKTQQYFEQKGVRSTYNETMINLVVAGNVVVHYTETGTRNFKLNNFVIVRDNEDSSIQELITKEKIFREELSEEQNEKLDMEVESETGVSNIQYELYTHIKLNSDGENYTIEQEIQGVILTTSETPREDLPYVAPRLYKDSDENYGESYVYRFYDDLRDLNNYRRQFIEATGTLTRLIWLVNPNGRASPREITKTKNGGFAVAGKDDISALQADNRVQLAELSNIIDNIKNDLKESFLMFSARSSDRTTAEEIRATQEQLDQQLGGVFSTLSQELQLPSVKAVEAILRETDPTYIHLPNTQDKIVTGVEAIGRSQEVQKLRTFLQLVAEISQVKPEFVDNVNEEWLAEELLKATGVNEKATIPHSEVKKNRQAQQQQAQQQQMQQQMLESGGKMAENALSNDQKQ